MAMSPEQFHQARLQGIGGSDAAAVCGLSPWKSAFDVWLEKTGQVEPPDLSEDPAVRAGIALEDVVAQYFAEDYGRFHGLSPMKLRRRHQTLRHPRYPWMIAHLDREIVGWSSLLECKTASTFFNKDEWGPTGTDLVPQHYYIQVAHYLAVTGKKEGFLAVLFGGREFRWYLIRRDEEIINALVSRERDFWECVEAKREPAIDFTHPRALETLKRLYPGTNGAELTFEEDNPEHADVVAAHGLYQLAALHKRTADKRLDEAKARLLEAMGEAAVAHMPDGSRYVRSLRQVKEYTVAAKEYMDFRCYAPKGAEKK